MHASALGTSALRPVEDHGCEVKMYEDVGLGKFMRVKNYILTLVKLSVVPLFATCSYIALRSML